MVRRQLDHIYIVPDHDTSVFIHLYFITGARSHLYLRIDMYIYKLVKRLAVTCRRIRSGPSRLELAAYIIVERRLEVISGYR